jgi:hypothetical protein
MVRIRKAQSLQAWFQTERSQLAMVFACLRGLVRISSAVSLPYPRRHGSRGAAKAPGTESRSRSGAAPPQRRRAEVPPRYLWLRVSQTELTIRNQCANDRATGHRHVVGRADSPCTRARCTHSTVTGQLYCWRSGTANCTIVSTTTSHVRPARARMPAIPPIRDHQRKGGLQ